MDAARLCALAKRPEDAAQTRRLLALAVIYNGGSRGKAAKIGSIGAASGPRRGARLWRRETIRSGGRPEAIITSHHPLARIIHRAV